MGSGVNIDLLGIKMAGPSTIAWQNHGVDVFPVALFKRLSTTLLRTAGPNGSTHPHCYPYASPFTHIPPQPSLTSDYEKAQIDTSYPYDTEVYGDPLLAFANPATQNRSRTESRPLGSLRHEGVVVCAAVPPIGMMSWVLT
jgi:hypothetical protein